MVYSKFLQVINYDIIQWAGWKLSECMSFFDSNYRVCVFCLRLSGWTRKFKSKCFLWTQFEMGTLSVNNSIRMSHLNKMLRIQPKFISECRMSMIHHPRLICKLSVYLVGRCRPLLIKIKLTFDEVNSTVCMKHEAHKTAVFHSPAISFHFLTSFIISQKSEKMTASVRRVECLKFIYEMKEYNDAKWWERVQKQEGCSRGENQWNLCNLLFNTTNTFPKNHSSYQRISPTVLNKSSEKLFWNPTLVFC